MSKPSCTFLYMRRKGHQIPRPTDGELELLRILWAKGKATVREIYDEVNKTRPLGYTSVLKLLQIMVVKRLVVRSEVERAHVYRAALSQQDTQTQILRDLSKRLFSGSTAQLAMHALGMENVDEGELDEIRRMIERSERKQ